ncbi:response regulator transcription factor [Actinocrinis puniceicyclus]|uniref:Response regulator transcription factor n=1 Tax=Actinocrinis puniceicyclus TaxID=977794 RepID=A0A8J7WS33_9ACTN|nr:response regulator transcription factor [Actinocrinis puniceicyclus]MBS2964309.1 response regulator transcription factor [Actinocrinis puniceicyclus]
MDTPVRRLILVVEDEPTLADAVVARLAAAGFATVHAGDGPGAMAAVREHKPDAVVLDVMLPGFDGLEVCRRIQRERPTPVLMLTARDAEPDLLAGLGSGADDYLTKPFSMRELIARVQALLRRVEVVREQTLEHARGLDEAQAARSVRLRGHAAAAGRGESHEEPRDGRPALELDHAARRVRVDGTDVHLTPIEFDLLGCLARKPGTVASRESLLAEVWDWADASGTRTVDSHIKALRKKIGAEWIRTVHGIGYALEAEADGEAATATATATGPEAAGAPPTPADPPPERP